MASSTTNDDDDWDKVEENLRTLDMSEKEKIDVTSTSEVDAVGDSDSNKIRSGPQWMCARNQLPPESQGVDSALVNALVNPRERMALFQIEDSILKFITSKERCMEIAPGHHNSFRRLLFYRVAQRFGLSHAASEICSDVGERGIVLYKTEASGVPSVLLIDMNIPVDRDGAAADIAGSGEFDPISPTSTRSAAISTTAVAARIASTAIRDGSNAPAANDSTPSGSDSLGKKVVMMKRRAGKGSGGAAVAGKSAAERQQQLQSAEEREKKYLEARARIFGGEIPDENSSTTPPPLQSQLEKETVVCSPKSNSGGSNCNGETVKLAATRITSAAMSTFSSQSMQHQQKEQHSPGGSSSRRGKPAVVDAGQWRGSNKSRVRDLQAERSDPDFVRRGGGSNNNNSGGGGGGRGLHSGGGRYQHGNENTSELQSSSEYYHTNQPHSSQDLTQHQQLQQQQSTNELRGNSAYGYQNPMGSYSTGNLPASAQMLYQQQQQQQYSSYLAYQQQLAASVGVPMYPGTSQHQDFMQQQQQLLLLNGYMQQQQQQQQQYGGYYSNQQQQQQANIPPPPVLLTPAASSQWPVLQRSDNSRSIGNDNTATDVNGSAAGAFPPLSR